MVDVPCYYTNIIVLLGLQEKQCEAKTKPGQVIVSVYQKSEKVGYKYRVITGITPNPPTTTTPILV